ncbi:hypothetical protein EZS27_016921 [termite gut metagenome]|uniref:DUF5007 domain-containing protein n=1 Tax=termite gut metagenome TaxID=433724 RepID=A0A5J4RNZ2_9ZZZZ
MKNNTIKFPVILASLIALNSSCVKDFLPDSLDAFDPEAGFTTTVYKPQLGKTTLMTGNFNPGNSTLPFTFEIVNMKRADGREAPELTEFFPVKVWKTPYLGTETSLAEIEAKRETEYRQLFQVRKHSGEFILWSNAISSFVVCAPDSGYVFDVLAQNSGGYKYTTKMRLIPTREVDYEPTNYLGTGLAPNPYVHPTSVTGVREAEKGLGITTEDIQVYFRKNTDIEDDGKGKTLTFRFYDSEYHPIDPDKFNLTRWESLVHGFEMEKTGEYVTYKIAYPIPLLKTVSNYTNPAGDKARVKFSYNRRNSTGMRVDASISLDFAIYTEAHWEILFMFVTGDPLFEDGHF